MLASVPPIKGAEYASPELLTALWHAIDAAFRAALEGLGAPKPWFLIGHSMGGAIGLRALHDGLPVQAAAFSAPMWGIAMHPALRAISAHDGAGVTVFLRGPGLQGLAERVSGVARPTAADRSIRNYGVGAQILLDLGVRDMIVMSSTRPSPTALEGYGLRIVGWRDMDGEDQS